MTIIVWGLAAAAADAPSSQALKYDNKNDEMSYLFCVKPAVSDTDKSILTTGQSFPVGLICALVSVW